MKDLPSKETLRAYADAVSKLTENIWLIDDAGVLHAAARFLYYLASAQEEPNEPSRTELLELADAIESCDCERDERPDCPRKYLAEAAREIRKMAGRRPDESELFNVAEYLNGRSVMIRTHADGEQRLFNSVGQEEVAMAIKQEHGIHLSPDQILMGWPIRELGVFNVGLRLEGDPTIKVWIVQDAQEAVGQPEQPDKPKIESLRDAAARFRNRCKANPDEDTADLCALALRRVDQLADLVLLHCADNTELGAQRDALRRLRAEIAQMREGCAE